MTISDDNALMKACAKYILGESTGVKIKGAPEKIKAFQDAALASKRLYESLCRCDAMSDVAPLIEAKRVAAENFKRATGLTWKL